MTAPTARTFTTPELLSLYARLARSVALLIACGAAVEPASLAYRDALRAEVGRRGLEMNA